MGTVCQQVHSQASRLDPSDSDRPAPHPFYAIPAPSPPEMPLSSQQISSLHNHQPLQAPSWYHPDDCTRLQPFYLIKHYQLYYCGQWSNGMPHGQGEVLTRDGFYFKGYFNKGVASGPQCLFLESSFTYYYGAVEYNQRKGRGKFVDYGYQYEGDWERSLPHGEGRQVYPNDDMYKGQFVLGRREGQGEYTWKQTIFQSYQGSFKNNEMQGRGRLRMREGPAWEGQFSCLKELLISNCQCGTEEPRHMTFRGDLAEGLPVGQFNVSEHKGGYSLQYSNGKLSGHVQTNQFGPAQQHQSKAIFQEKVLHHYEGPPEVINNIIRAVEKGYSEARKHSQALQTISEDLPAYTLSFWEKGEPLEGIAIVPICGRFVRVQAREAVS